MDWWSHKGEGSFLVFDLGGGTYDVTLLELYDGVMEVHASAGDNFLGGEDFLDVLLGMFYAEKKSEIQGLDLGKDAVVQAVLRRRCEQAKRALSDAEETSIQLPIKDHTVDWTIDRKRFEQACQGLLQRLKRPIETALRDARIAPNELEEVVLVGGASRMPMIARMVSRMFGRIPNRCIDPDLTVAYGAGMQAAMKARHEALEEVVLTDVCPYTLGVSALSDSPLGDFVDIFVPIIERNTTVPVSRIKRFFTVADNQAVVDVEVFQGESRNPSNNISLGKLQIEMPRKQKAGAPIDTRFTYDVNGLLEVEVTVVSTGVVTRLVLQENDGVLSDAEINERLEQLSRLKIHPREKMENKQLLEKADRWFSECLGHVREVVGLMLDRFRSALESQDPKIIAESRAELKQVLDEIESGRVKLD